MTHRGDSDWHGWPLQEVLDRVAQKRYADMRERWPETLRTRTPELLADVPKSNPIGRQIKEAGLAGVIEVLDVLNDMPHPVVTEVRMALARLDAAYVARQHGGVAEHNAIEEIEQIMSRYTHTEGS